MQITVACSAKLASWYSDGLFAPFYFLGASYTRIPCYLRWRSSLVGLPCPLPRKCGNYFPQCMHYTVQFKALSAQHVTNLKCCQTLLLKCFIRAASTFFSRSWSSLAIGRALYSPPSTRPAGAPAGGGLLRFLCLGCLTIIYLSGYSASRSVSPPVSSSSVYKPVGRGCS